jgi:hypothetical protein
MNVFRSAGFDLGLTIDNRKSWIQTGATTRIDDSTPQYYQQDSRLVLNTKEVDVALDTARGIEYDVYQYIQKDFAINNSGYTMPFSYVNISLGLTGTTQTTFKLPAPYNKQEGDLEVRINGVLLNAPKTGNTGSTGMDLTQADYSADTINNTFTLLTGVGRSDRDVIQATFIYSGATAKPVTGITVQYVVARINPNLIVGTTIPLPSFPRGDVQVTINGIALTKGTPQFTADYILDPANSTGGSNNIIIQNPEIIGYLAVSPYVQIAYVEVTGSNDINARSEVVRVDSFNSSKIYYNVGANKYVYRLNYKVNNANEVKFLIDGIALKPPVNNIGGDYSINDLDPYEVFLPSGIRYGTVISAYYLVGGNAIFNPIVSDDFGLGDISQLSFLEFIDLIQRKMINARNRKTVSDFKGGWYPALLRLYELYLERGLLPENNPLHSNGYTFANLYPFLSKYNAFFQKFVDQLLSATIILRGGGLLIRNTVFTKQKFMYKRGVNIPMAKIVDIDKDLYYPEIVPLSAYTPAYNHLCQRATLQYRGDDGSTFEIAQTSAPLPIILHVETCAGTAGTCGPPALGYINTGGFLVSGYTNVSNYGMEYKKCTNSSWCISPSPLSAGPLGVDNYASSICNLDEGIYYDFRAVVQVCATPAYGDTLSLCIPVTPPVPPPLAPSGLTRIFDSSTSDSFINAGGCCIQGYQCVEWYGMQYRCIGTVDISVSPTVYSSISSLGTTCPVQVCGPSWNNTTVSTACSWLTISTPVAPSVSPGTTNNVVIAANIGSARSGVVCYTPVNGTIKCVTFCQDAYVPSSKEVCILCCGPSCGCGTNYCDAIVEAYGVYGNAFGGNGINPSMVAGECFYPTFCWSIIKPSTAYAPQPQCIVLLCNGTAICTKTVSAKGACNCSGNWSTVVKYGDCIDVITCATAQLAINGGQATPSYATIYMTSITNGVGSFSIGPSTFSSSITCSNTVISPI